MSKIRKRSTSTAVVKSKSPRLVYTYYTMLVSSLVERRRIRLEVGHLQQPATLLIYAFCFICSVLYSLNDAILECALHRSAARDLRKDRKASARFGLPFCLGVKLSSTFCPRRQGHLKQCALLHTRAFPDFSSVVKSDLSMYCSTGRSEALSPALIRSKLHD